MQLSSVPCVRVHLQLVQRRYKIYRLSKAVFTEIGTNGGTSFVAMCSSPDRDVSKKGIWEVELCQLLHVGIWIRELGTG